MQSDGNAWLGWVGEQQQVMMRAGRNAGRASLLLAWQMCPFPPGTPASLSDLSEAFVPWAHVRSKTQVMT